MEVKTFPLLMGITPRTVMVADLMGNENKDEGLPEYTDSILLQLI